MMARAPAHAPLPRKSFRAFDALANRSGPYAGPHGSGAEGPGCDRPAIGA